MSQVLPRSLAAFLVVLAGLLSVPSASAAAPAIQTTSVNFASVDVVFSTPGQKFQLAAFRVRERTNGVLTNDQFGAHAQVFNVECDEVGSCQTTSFFECLPPGNPPNDFTLPPGALNFEPKTATLITSFGCLNRTSGDTFTLAVSLGWSTTSFSAIEPSVQDDPGPPRTLTISVNKLAFGVPVTGSASDGATQYVDALTSGVLFDQQTTTITFP